RRHVLQHQRIDAAVVLRNRDPGLLANVYAIRITRQYLSGQAFFHEPVDVGNFEFARGGPIANDAADVFAGLSRAGVVHQRELARDKTNEIRVISGHAQVEHRFHVAVGEEVGDGDGDGVVFRGAQAVAEFQVRGGRPAFAEDV